MTPGQVKRAIAASIPEEFVGAHLLDRVPHVFGGERKSYIMWCSKLAAGLEIDPTRIIVVGSAAIGVSLNPNKDFVSFRSASDVDAAVVSDHFFELAWRELRLLRARAVELDGDEQRPHPAH